MADRDIPDGPEYRKTGDEDSERLIRPGDHEPEHAAQTSDDEPESDTGGEQEGQS